MKLFICPNRAKESQAQTARACIQALEAGAGAECLLSPGDARALFGTEHRAGRPEECDLIVSIGGDGAVLRAAQTAIAWDKPLLGVNAGRLGYLCALEADALPGLAGDTLLRGLTPSPRTLLAFTYAGEERLALNDVVAAKENFGGTVTLLAERQGAPLALWRGDGLIVSTPTGSTAYCQSAGGPLVDARADVLTLMPICPHSGPAHALVLDAGMPLRLSPRAGERICLYSDGVPLGPLTEPLEIRRSEKRLLLFSRENEFSGWRRERKNTR